MAHQNKEDTFMVSFLFLSKGMGDSNSDGGTSVNKTVRWTVFSESREAKAEQGQIAEQYASPMAHQTKKSIYLRIWTLSFIATTEEIIY